MISVAYFGSHPLGRECLRLLHEHEEVDVEVVVTYPAGYDSWWEGSVFDLATELGYDILTTDEESAVQSYDIDYIISVYYPNILGPELLDHPDEGALNLHQAELPRYRGSNVFSHAIINARDDDHWKYGTTIHFMAEAVDAGDIVDRKFVEIKESDTARCLYDRTRGASVELFEETLPKIVSGEVHDLRTPQSAYDTERYFYDKSSLDDLKEIPSERLSDNSIELYDLIRALDFPPFQPAYTYIAGNKINLTAKCRSYSDNRGD